MRPREAILIAVALVFVIGNWVPFGHEALYPLTLFTTWVHEMGHGLTALALGGRFDSLEIFSHAGGLAHCDAGWGWHMAVVALGGLLAPPIVGSILIAFVHGPRRARIALTILAVGLVVSLVIYVRSVAGFIAMPLVAAGLGWAAWLGFREAPQRGVLVVQLLGVILALDTLTRMVSYVFVDEIEMNGVKMPSDIHSVAEGFGSSYLLWGAAVTLVAVAMLGGALWWAWKRPAPAERKTAAARR